MKLTNTQYNSIMQEYRRLQQDRDELIRKRKRELREKVPGFARLDDDFIAQGRKALFDSLSQGGRADFKGLTESVIFQEKDLLRRNGYPEDYLDPPYQCPDCRDSGYIDGEPCHCMKKRAIEIVFKDEPVMKRMLTDRFSDFSLDYYPTDRIDPQTGASARDWAKRALEASRGFVDTFGDGIRNIVFYGSAGSGKTFLSSCIAGSLLREGKTVLYLSAARLFDVMADHSFRRDGYSDDVGYTSIFSSDLLIIDDLGTEISNAFTSLSLFDVIQSRASSEKAVIISTNLDLKEIRGRYTDRIYSRLIERYNFYHLFGFDGRYENGLKNLKPAKKNGGH
ncbi:MAG: ATP-binding protein [Lachnospiraceae bacterium]|nr:ATP-binding protein [Lachnospiraceae bacterium]MDY6352982.1 ATP-binding protein [Lachnospiraceae bacterium]